MYLHNSWYVAAWSREIADKPISITILEEPIVFFRKSDGDVVALEDRCPHRHLPLSMGSVDGDMIRCGYHGMVFDGDGRCKSVPSQQLIPSRARVKAYYVIERFGWVWVWMGDKDAEPGLIPDFGILVDPAHKAVGNTSYVRASYQLIVDNLMDLSHLGFVHTTTIGNYEMGAKGKLSVQRSDDSVVALRPVPDVPPPPLYIKSGVLPEGKNIDRWTKMTYIAPSFVFLHGGGAETGTGVLEGRYDHGLSLWVLNAMTPETPTSTHYFWASVRSYALDDEKVDELFLSSTAIAFEEDKRVLEAQQAVIERRGDSWSVALKGDAASIECRRLLAKRIAAESGGPKFQAETEVESIEALP